MIRTAWTTTPMAVRDDLALLRHARLVAQLPMLNATFVVFAVVSMIGLNPDAPAWVRFAMPIALAGTCLWRIRVWLRRRGEAVEPDKARATIGRTIVIALAMCAFCSAWSVLTWADATPLSRAYIALFTATGVLSVSYCLASVRAAAIATLGIGLAPTSLLLLAAGGQAERAAGIGIVVAGLFLTRTMLQHHQQLVSLLALQHDMRRLATTDALTGLCNRRALYDGLSRGLAQAGTPTGAPAIALIDLDGFKAINDRHGHAAGDAVLRVTAHRLQAEGGDACLVACRLGGDEFALLMTDLDDAGMAAFGARLQSALAAPIEVGGRVIRVGASVGWAIAGDDVRDADTLMALADRALYAEKAIRRRFAGTRLPGQPVRKALVIG